MRVKQLYDVIDFKEKKRPNSFDCLSNSELPKVVMNITVD